KLRYTSLQSDTGAGEEWEDFEGIPSLGAMPVVACGLHSHVACVAAAFKANAPAARLVYVMTDGAALPMALSDLVHALVSANFVCPRLRGRPTRAASGHDPPHRHAAGPVAVARLRPRADGLRTGRSARAACPR